MKKWFHLLASKVSFIAGTPLAFSASLSLVAIWALTGPLFNFSNTWQLAINTSTTIITFLMVFLIQNTQNRDAKAMHLKVDELIRATRTARDSFIDLEDISDEELALLDIEFKRLHDESGNSAVAHIHSELLKVRTKRVKR